jgi:hypothetical protein
VYGGCDRMVMDHTRRALNPLGGCNSQGWYLGPRQPDANVLRRLEQRHLQRL